MTSATSTALVPTVHSRLPMTCRLIVAIDRSLSVQDAYEHIELAEKLRGEYGDMIVGIDLGGNPTKVC